MMKQNGRNKMKNIWKFKIKNLLLLGGFIDLLSIFATMFHNVVFETIALLVFLFFIYNIVIILFKPENKNLENFKTKYPKISAFLMWIGILPYLSLPISFIYLTLAHSDTIQTFTSLYGAFLEILSYILYACGLIMFLKMFYQENKVKNG